MIDSYRWNRFFKLVSLSGFHSLSRSNSPPPISLLSERAGNEWLLVDLASHSRSPWKCLTWSNQFTLSGLSFSIWGKPHTESNC